MLGRTITLNCDHFSCKLLPLHAKGSAEASNNLGPPWGSLSVRWIDGNPGPSERGSWGSFHTRRIKPFRNWKMYLLSKMWILDIDTKFQGGKWDSAFEDDWISLKKNRMELPPHPHCQAPTRNMTLIIQWGRRLSWCLVIGGRPRIRFG